MNIAKYMEAIVIAVIAVAAAASMATASVPSLRTAQAPAVSEVVTHVVYVSAKRLSAEEKAAL
ncbi:hypothetical protein [Janthinobacterium aquaticum]|uniref:hypothetical protein n=1 Tax=Janthinobacterium sp. FT58W TaxID=2654254 RepID=UPI0012653BE9|nr:hypothetical protein [Janthinobacterium sp. FT58W]KAB8041419.1 hypothetical protein GCM43_18520 [Janthinobacterium sp. FT58W]